MNSINIKNPYVKELQKKLRFSVLLARLALSVPIAAGYCGKVPLHVLYHHSLPFTLSASFPLLFFTYRIIHFPAIHWNDTLLVE